MPRAVGGYCWGEAAFEGYCWGVAALEGLRGVAQLEEGWRRWRGGLVTGVWLRRRALESPKGVEVGPLGLCLGFAQGVFAWGWSLRVASGVAVGWAERG